MRQFLPEYKNPCFFEETQLRCLPYFYLAGSPKCGTSDLWFNLLRHPQVYDGVRKESHFWKNKNKDCKYSSQKWHDDDDDDDDDADDDDDYDDDDDDDDDHDLDDDDDDYGGGGCGGGDDDDDDDGIDE